MSDEDILQKLLKGNEEAFAEIVDLYKNKIISLCFSYTKSFQEAEDLSQEVFISFFRSLPNFKGNCSISTYIYKISISKCMDYKRKSSVKQLLMGLISSSRSNENIKDDNSYVRDSIMKLPEDLKKVIILYYYTGLSQKEIADVLDVPVKTVEGRIRRAKQKLRKEFEEEGYSVCSKSGII